MAEQKNNKLQIRNSTVDFLVFTSVKMADVVYE